ncbi:MBL fold metallo-hydrolase [Melioribacteraceae bacterium 4301-Me]|uniref:MBL fold metallo-hydrolase n=1 Tax=Pyranulibacter aquaticus TaxID=3163344 RepID=UPI003595AC23
MRKNKYYYKNQYPLVWQKDDFFIKIYSSTPNVATGILLTTKNSTFVIDPGDGILRDLNKDVGTKTIMKISDIFISHGHHDHIGGIWSLLTYLSVLRRKEPLKIYYPKGCIEIESIYKAFTDVYSKELSYKISLIKIDNQKPFVRKSIRIKPFKVNHREPTDDGSSSIAVPSLGYKFFYNNKSICYGGDTAYCDNLLQNAKNSDLAIIEAGAETEESSDLHMTISQAMQIGKLAKKYFLVHLPE